MVHKEAAGHTSLLLSWMWGKNCPKGSYKEKTNGNYGLWLQGAFPPYNHVSSLRRELRYTNKSTEVSNGEQHTCAPTLNLFAFHEKSICVVLPPPLPTTPSDGDDCRFPHVISSTCCSPYPQLLSIGLSSIIYLSCSNSRNHTPLSCRIYLSIILRVSCVKNSKAAMIMTAVATTWDRRWGTDLYLAQYLAINYNNNR